MKQIPIEELRDLAPVMSDKDKVLLAQALQTFEEAEKRAKFQNLFPDEGPLRRELYPVHCEFFKAGSKYRERLLMAANRFGKCSTINSLIETPDGKVRVGDLVSRGKPFDVFAWDGERKVVARASAPFRKPVKEPCVRIDLEGGEWFEAALGHRILTCEGWLHVGDFVQLSRRRAGLPDDLLLSSWGYGQSIHGEDGWRYCRTPQGSRADYPLGCHFGDGQPRGCAAFGLAPTPLPDDVPEHSPALSRSDGRADRRTNSPSECVYPLSILDASRQPAGLSVAFQGSGVGTIARPLSDQHRAAWPLPTALTDLLQSACAGSLHRIEGPSGSQGATGCYSESNNLQGHRSSRLAPRQSPCGAYPAQSLIELGDRPLQTPTGVKIQAVHFIGCHEVFDFEVAKFHNYLGAGLVHHNTIACGFEVSAHLTGNYPHWWEGKRFDEPIDAWVAGDTNETTRDIIQKTLLGEVTWDKGRKRHDGVGIIPYDAHGTVRWKTGVPDLTDYVEIQHASGGWSRLGFKSYDQGRRVFQGTAKHLIWLDEECPIDVYGECLIRTATTGGIMMLSFTPLLGMSELVRSFLQPDTGGLANA